ncbi:hypothetical protein ACFRFJ_15710 [Streptomyces hydrogenans]|uniref:hypothetical protein n=1 Tax=Streptomyces hydrogenans TaxID=1873719 RepID=UPI0036B8FC5C
MARSSYTPTEDAAALFRQKKALLEAEEELKEPLRAMAIREMREAGATVGDLARLTGMSDEYFRRLARAAGIKLRRPPVVRKSEADG